MGETIAKAILSTIFKIIICVLCDVTPLLLFFFASHNVMSITVEEKAIGTTLFIVITSLICYSLTFYTIRTIIQSFKYIHTDSTIFGAMICAIMELFVAIFIFLHPMIYVSICTHFELGFLFWVALAFIILLGIISLMFGIPVLMNASKRLIQALKKARNRVKSNEV